MKTISKNEFTLFHHILFIIISVGIADGDYSEDELNDLKLTANTLGEWFGLNESDSMSVAQETYNYIVNYAKQGKLKEILKISLYSCAFVKASVGELEIEDKTKQSIIDNIVTCINDQASADSIILEVEKNVVDLFTKALY